METQAQTSKESIDDLLSIFPVEVMNLNLEEQKISLQIYRLLAEGQPVALKRIAETSGLETDLVENIVNSWPGVFYDNTQRIIGYWGLALVEMTHRFQVDGTTLYTWCAWDSLFIPALLQKTAQVESECAQTGEKIRLTITPDAITQTDPRDLKLSFITPHEAKIKENVITNFCHFVHFFRSQAAAEQWVSEHDGAFTISLEEANLLGRKKNERQYKDIL